MSISTHAADGTGLDDFKAPAARCPAPGWIRMQRAETGRLQSPAEDISMHRKFIVALTWLLIVALPVQAMAANVMIHCGPQHGGADANHSKSADHHHADGVSHSHGPGSSETARQAHAHVGPADAGAPDLTDFAKCSACASCCVGAALPVTPRSVVVAPPQRFTAVSQSRIRTGHLRARSGTATPFLPRLGARRPIVMWPAS